MIDPVDRDFNRYSREVERMDAYAEAMEEKDAENAILVDRINALLIENRHLLKRVGDEATLRYQEVEEAKMVWAR